jgi:limonene-1,2-epoxide hydrolase
VRYAIVLSVAVLLSGCGGGSTSPESVVRGWSAALDRGDNDRAARYFAAGAQVVQGGTVTRLRSEAAAIAFNRSLPCAGRIVDLRVEGSDVTAIFVLSDRPGSLCDGPGQKASAVIRVRGGRIVLWHQVATIQSSPGETI